MHQKPLATEGNGASFSKNGFEIWEEGTDQAPVQQRLAHQSKRSQTAWGASGSYNLSDGDPMPETNRILLISKEDNLRYTLKRILEQDGFRVECAREFCHDILAAFIPQVDFIVLDTDKALDSCEELLTGLHLARLSVPVLVLAASLPLMSGKTLEREGLVVRQKPMEPASILRTIREQLNENPRPTGQRTG